MLLSLLWVLGFLGVAGAALFLYAFRLIRPSRAERDLMRTTDLPRVRLDDGEEFDVLTASAVQLARLVRERRLTSSDLVAAYVDQQKRVNPVINATVDQRYSIALKEAQLADERVAACRSSAELDALPPLWGVPCSIKECFAVEGMSHTAGYVPRLGKPATEDATAVKRLREAGAIVLGVTNTSELCMWMESNNKAFGRTNNPYNSRHIVGGSSGGEGCIVSACGAPFGLGSDIGGSIRLPAFMNGCFGHKPTGGLVPGTGQFPISDPGDAIRFLTTGPITRHAEDLWPLLQILAGPDGHDSGCEEMQLGDPEDVDLSKVTIFTIPHPRVALGPPSKDLRDAQERAFEHLRTVCAADSREITLHKISYAVDIWSNMLQSAQTTPFRELLNTGGDFRELGKWFLGRSDHTLPAIGLALLERVTDAMPVRQRQFVDIGNELKQELVELFKSVEGSGHAGGRHAVILFPSYSQTAPVHNQPLFPPINYAYTCIWNSMQVPVTQVPLGLSASTGLPTGVQVVGLHGHDHVTVAIARELERKFGGWAHRE